jgi:hypothetical protein
VKSHPIYSIFLDESSQTKHRFLTLGCLVIDAARVPYFEIAVRYSKQLELPEGELKWNKVSNAKLHAYKLVVDRFFDLSVGDGPIHFHSLVVDTSKIRDDLYNQGDREVGFNKEVYQLLMKCAKIYPDALFHVYPDQRETKAATEDLRKMLNAGCKKNGDTRDAPFRRVQFQDSKKIICLQMTDLLLGAMTFRINAHHLRPDASKSKTHLSDYVLGRANVVDATQNTAVRGKYTIWHRRLREEGSRKVKARSLPPL